MNNDIIRQEMLLSAVRRRGQSLRYGSDDLRNNCEVVMAAVKEDGLALEFASDQLKNDHTVVAAAVQQNGRAFQFAPPELQLDYDISLLALQTPLLGKEIVDLIPDTFKKNRDFMLKAIKINACAIYAATDTLSNDRLFVMEAIRQTPSVFSYLHYKFKDDAEVASEAVNLSKYSCHVLSDRLGKNHGLIKYITSKLEIFSTPLQTFLSTILFALRLVPALSVLEIEEEKCARKRIKVHQNSTKLVILHKLGRYRLVTVKQLIADYAGLQVGHTYDKLVNITKHLVAAYGNSLQWASPELKNNQHIVFAAVKNDPSALQYASDDVRNDVKFVIAAIDQASPLDDILRWVSDELKNNRAVVMAAVSKHENSL